MHRVLYTERSAVARTAGQGLRVRRERMGECREGSEEQVHRGVRLRGDKVAEHQRAGERPVLEGREFEVEAERHVAVRDERAGTLARVAAERDLVQEVLQRASALHDECTVVGHNGELVPVHCAGSDLDEYAWAGLFFGHWVRVAHAPPLVSPLASGFELVLVVWNIAHGEHDARPDAW